MELWYTEEHSPNCRFSLRVTRQLHSEKTPFQQLDIVDTPEYGRVMLLDGLVMTTERDEYVYHELITHVPLACLPDARRVLIIGGGDGGTAREVCRYPGLETVDMVEIDGAVIAAARIWFPDICAGFADPRLNLTVGDGMEYVKKVTVPYDAIIVDSTDPVGPGEHLFNETFYRDCYAALGERGVLVSQGPTPIQPQFASLLREQAEFIARTFDRFYLYLGHIPTYPTGTWCFLFAAKGGIEPLASRTDTGWCAFGERLKYYNPALHRGAFGLPTYVRRQLDGLIANDRLDIA
jgi:spermidine synthase